MASIPAEGFSSDQSLFFSYLARTTISPMVNERGRKEEENENDRKGKREGKRERERALGETRISEKDGREEPRIAERQ